MEDNRSERCKSVWKLVTWILKEQYEDHQSLCKKAEISAVTLWKFLSGGNTRVSTLNRLEKVVKEHSKEMK